MFIELHRMSQATHVSLGSILNADPSISKLLFSGNKQKKALKYSLYCRGGQKWAENCNTDKTCDKKS